LRPDIKAYLTENKDKFAQPDEAGQTVRIDSFGDSTINLLINCFTRTIDYEEWMTIKEDLAFKIREIVEEKAKASFAFPSQSIYVENFDDMGKKK
jgi:MscS family membrane protein